MQIGAVGEHLAAAAIVRAGYSCDIVNGQGYDIIVFDDKDVYRVEVKSASEAKRVTVQDKCRFYSYCVARGSRVKRLISDDDADIVALVANDIKAVTFMPVKDVKTMRVRLKTNDFGDETKSFREAIKGMQR